MKTFTTELKIDDIIAQAKGEYISRFDSSLISVSELEEADSNSVCFYENEAYADKLKACKAGLIIVNSDFDNSLNQFSNLLKVDKPYFTFMVLVKLWIEIDKQTRKRKISDNASISSTATIGENVLIGDFVVIEDNVKIGNDTTIEANCVIKEDSIIGNNCHLFPNCTIYDNMVLGNSVTLHAGAVVGADGFGYILYNNIQEKVPQIGNVIIKDNVEIGANTCIDRGTIGSTTIEKHTKIDNLVQIGHNVKIGENTIICSQVGIAGSTTVGDFVYLAGQVGVADHVTIGNRVMAGAKSGIHSTVKDGMKLLGYPARDVSLQRRIMAAETKLPDMFKSYLKTKKKENKE
jgi:UDP-3-O-[3-hydroxymyristoyl] glucosamine N-acyltransferase